MICDLVLSRASLLIRETAQHLKHITATENVSSGFCVIAL